MYHDCSLCLSGATTNLGEEEIDTKGGVLVIEVALELSDLFSKHVWGVSNLKLSVFKLYKHVMWQGLSYSSNDTEATGIGDCCSQLGPSSNVHASKDDWVFDLEKIGGGGLQLLWGGHCEGMVE